MQAPQLEPRFVRRLSLLCCHCVRNIAYYRVGFVGEDGTGSLKQPSQFGATVNGDLLDIAVLEWCKLFADRNARHHWKRFVRADDDQKQFLSGLLAATGISLEDWKRYLDQMRVYRDKFVAHLDDQQVMNIPTLDGALSSTFFLYENVRAKSPDHIFRTPHLVHLPDDLEVYYEACCDEGRAAYGAARNFD
ncbi:hypothetical protein PAQ31011_05137 [Pandoraea aquatica]|uniref:HEPN AbiU2-like domain-containing protein n=1 Tax=Pandoraea aquatica TaxID=2508290 RepID=A0A5E4Z657_9BURK|nr:hypothetical protein [Pandoraea aquatica]VVE56741.1 hypothetical protein PAQ31011_05137 [Pandoraea aquatica]